MPIGFWLLSAASFLLEVGVLVSILRSRLYRSYPIILAISVFGVAGVLLFTVALHYWRTDSLSYGVFYWTTDFLNHALILLLVISLIGRALDPPAGKAVLVLTLFVFAWGLGWLAVLRNEPAWETALTVRLSFCEEILNFILWIALIRSRRRDTILFLVTAGIGLQVTGEVIGHTIRIYAGRRFLWLPDILVVVAEMLCLLIWNYAFWTAPAAESIPSPSSPPPA